jgi:hypothetical protein
MSVLQVMTKLDPKRPSMQIGTGGKADIDWEDVAGAISRLPSIQQDWALLQHNPNDARITLSIVELFYPLLFNRIMESGINPKKSKVKDGLTELCKRITLSALIQAANPAKTYTRAQRMELGGINMSERAYFDRWVKYEELLKWFFDDMTAQVESSMAKYIRQTKADNIILT